MKISQRIATLGVSRGLGKEFVRKWNHLIPNDSIFLSSRKTNDLELLKSELVGQNHVVRSCDFSKKDLRADFLKDLESFSPERIFYFAGGGPFGPFADKNIQSHEWAYEVNFLFPAALLHWALSLEKKPVQIVFVGSAIAENLPDPMAASYSASKHALRGLVTTVQLENPDFDLRLFSPGYMDTSMLPPHAAPRNVPGLVLNASKAAQALFSWTQSLDDASRQLLYTKHE